jgi:hypothetical protein
MLAKGMKAISNGDVEMDLGTNDVLKWQIGSQL